MFALAWGLMSFRGHRRRSFCSYKMNDDDDIYETQPVVSKNWNDIKKVLGCPTKTSIQDWKRSKGTKPSAENEDCLLYYIDMIKTYDWSDEDKKKKTDAVIKYIDALKATRPKPRDAVGLGSRKI